MSQTNSIKTRYEVILFEEGQTGIKNIAENFNLSISELLDQIGCGSLAIVDSEDLEDYLDLQDALEAEADPDNQERISWEQVQQEIGL